MRQEALMDWAKKQTSNGRKEFEKFIKSSPYPISLDKTDGGKNYISSVTQLAWESWKASRKALRKDSE